MLYTIDCCQSLGEDLPLPETSDGAEFLASPPVYGQSSYVLVLRFWISEGLTQAES